MTATLPSRTKSKKKTAQKEIATIFTKNSTANNCDRHICTYLAVTNFR